MTLAQLLQLINGTGAPLFFCLWLMRKDDNRDKANDAAALAMRLELAKVTAELTQTKLMLVTQTEVLRGLVDDVDDINTTRERNHG